MARILIIEPDKNTRLLYLHVLQDLHGHELYFSTVDYVFSTYEKTFPEIVLAEFDSQNESTVHTLMHILADIKHVLSKKYRNPTACIIYSKYCQVIKRISSMHTVDSILLKSSNLDLLNNAIQSALEKQNNPART